MAGVVSLSWVVVGVSHLVLILHVVFMVHSLLKLLDRVDQAHVLFPRNHNSTWVVTVVRLYKFTV